MAKRNKRKIDSEAIASPALPPEQTSPEARKALRRSLASIPEVVTEETDATLEDVVKSGRKALRADRRARGVTQSGGARKASGGSAQPVGLAAIEQGSAKAREAASNLTQEDLNEKRLQAKRAAEEQEGKRNKPDESFTETTAPVYEPADQVDIETPSRGGGSQIEYADTGYDPGFDNPDDYSMESATPRGGVSLVPPSEASRRAAFHEASMSRLKESLAADVVYGIRKRRNQPKGFNPFDRFGPARRDVPSVPITVAGAKARQSFFMNDTGKSQPLVTGNPAVERVLVEDPTQEYGVGTELRPVPTPLTRDSIYNTYVGPASRLLNEVDQAKSVTEAIHALDIIRSNMPRVFVSHDKPEVKSDETVLSEGETGELEPKRVTTTETGKHVRPTRRQALRSLTQTPIPDIPEGTDTSSEEGQALVRARDEALARRNYGLNLRRTLAVGIRKFTGDQPALSGIWRMSGDTDISQEFLDNVKAIADLAQKNATLAETPGGRRRLIESGGRPSFSRGEPSKLGGLVTAEGYELRDLLSQEDYEKEVEAAVSASPGMRVIPQPRDSGPSSIQSTVPQAEDKSISDIAAPTISDIPTEPYKAGIEIRGRSRNIQEGINRTLRDAEAAGRLDEVKNVLLNLSGRTTTGIGVQPMVKGEENQPQETVGNNAPSDQRTVREQVIANWQPTAEAQRNLARNALGSQRTVVRFGTGGRARVVNVRRSNVGLGKILSPGQLDRFTAEKAALVTGAESATQKDIEKTMSSYPGQSVTTRGREGSTALTPGSGLKFTSTGAVAPISDDWMVRANLFESGDWPAHRQTAQLFTSGALDTVSILPGGKLGTIGGRVTEPTPAHHLYGMTDDEREAYRLKRISEMDAAEETKREQRHAQPTGPARLEVPFPHVKQILGESTKARESRIVDESVAQAAALGSPLAPAGLGNVTIGEGRSKDEEGSDTTALFNSPWRRNIPTPGRTTVVRARDIPALIRSGGMLGVMVPSKRPPRQPDSTWKTTEERLTEKFGPMLGPPTPSSVGLRVHNQTQFGEVQ
jgi:hypothetical protein